MIWFKLTVISFVLFKVSDSLENNVCSTYRDYRNMKNNSNCWYNFAAEAKVPEIIRRTGYPFIEYKVQTKDGYILTVHRIPSFNSRKAPVFLLHGVQSSSGIFVGLGRNSIAFLLADAGHDVWLGNYRGNEYSEGHATLNITAKEYWDYGVDEIALIDLPTMLNLVSHHTSHKGKIIYMGHSLGTTAAIMYASDNPSHAKQTVQLFIWLSPAYKLTHMRSPYRFFFPLMKTALSVTNRLNVVHLLSRGYGREITGPTCLSAPAFMFTCLNLLNLFLGPFTQMAPETIPVFFNQFPGGTSLKTFTYLSEAVKGRFNKYDYGSKDNMRMYGSNSPPEYNLTKIQVPVFIIYASHDWATTKQDAIHLYETLPKSVRFGIHGVPNLDFNHFDFLFGRNVKPIVYDKLMKLLNYVHIKNNNMKKLF